MSSSSTPTKYYADASGYVTSRPRRDPPAVEERDPYEGSEEATSETPTLSPKSILPTPAPQSAPRGPRVRATARKSVPLPRRVTIADPPRTEGETSRQQAHGETQQVVTGVPMRHVPGMTPAEGRWVQGMARELHTHQARLDQHHYVLGNLTEILDSHNRHMIRALEAATAARRAVRMLYLYLLFGVLVMMMLGLL